MKRLTILAATCAIVCGCAKSDPPPPAPKPSIRTATVTAQKVRPVVEATGTVQPDLDGGAKVLSPLAGVVEKIYVRIGDSVARGTPLAAVRSAEVSDTYASSLATQAQLKQAERSYELNRKLFEIGAVTKNDLLASQANYEQSKAIAAGMEKKLAIYGATAAGGSRGTLIVRAPVGGRVVEIPAHLGDRFDTSTPLMTVANPEKSLVVANIYDTAIDGIRKGREVEFTTDVYPGTTFKGVVTYVSDVEDPDSKTVKAYIKPRGGSILKQNMFLKISFQGEERPLPVVAKSCLIYNEGKFHVRLKNGDRFELKEVKPVRDLSDKLTAVEGIREGDVIAASAIDMEQP